MSGQIVKQKKTPEEYTKLLEQCQKASNEVAELYVKKMYDVLIKTGDYAPHEAREKLFDDCYWWARGYIDKYVPDEAKDQSKQIGASVSVQNRRIRVDQDREKAAELAPLFIKNPTEKQIELARKIGVKNILTPGVRIQSNEHWKLMEAIDEARRKGTGDYTIFSKDRVEPTTN
jgi:hypothetical protein